MVLWADAYISRAFFVDADALAYVNYHRTNRIRKHSRSRAAAGAAVDREGNTYVRQNSSLSFSAEKRPLHGSLAPNHPSNQQSQPGIREIYILNHMRAKTWQQDDLHRTHPLFFAVRHCWGQFKKLR